MTNKDPRELEARQLEDYISAQGTTGLVGSLFYRDMAVKHVLADRQHLEHQMLRRSLMNILNGDDLMMDLHVRSVAAQIDSIPPSVEHGFLPGAIKESAGMEQQIAAIHFLAPLSAQDDDLYQLLWKVAQGRTSRVTNVSTAAIRELSLNAFSTRKNEFMEIALDSTRKSEERVLAYKVMAGAGMFTDPDVYKAVCDIASDSSITGLYERQGQLAPIAQFWFDSEMDMRRQYSDKQKDGKTNLQVKQEVVNRVQKEFQEHLFDVVDYVIDVTYSTTLHNQVFDMNMLRGSAPITSQRLTREVCRLLVDKPSYRVQTVIKYVENMRLSEPEARHIVTSLETVRKGRRDSNSGWIDSTLNKVQYKLGRKDDGGYLARDYLEKIWNGEVTPEEVVASWNRSK